VRSSLLASILVLAAALTACSGDEGKDDDAKEPKATQTVAAPAPAAPKAGACYPLPFETAVAPTSEIAAVPCTASHTSETVAVGTINAVVDGHQVSPPARRP
jgi:hypothetical protein